MRIYPRNSEDKEVEVRYQVEEGKIRATPWPFAVDSHRGYLVGYRLEGYPEVLEPVMVTYELVKRVVGNKVHPLREAFKVPGNVDRAWSYATASKVGLRAG